MWICPACQQPLSLDANVWQCCNNHRYDRAKEGYVNLQLAQERNSKSPGDNKDMIMARRTFLEAGHYDPLIKRIAEQIAAKVPNQDIHLFDAGCGEGYYLAKVQQLIQQQARQCFGSGCDIAKVAVQKAAKRYPDSQFCVASTYKIPLPDASMNAVLQVFAPSCHQDVARILDNDGIWICVNPGPNHLQELKQHIYSEFKAHSLEAHDFPQFTSVARDALTFSIQLDDPEVRMALLKMTPFYWHGSEEAKARFIADKGMVTADFDIHLLQKSPS